MNLVGKIFTVVIVLLSIMFASMSLMVFATHQNYKVQAAAKQKELNEIQQKLAEVQRERDGLAAQIKKDRDTYEATAGKLQTQVRELSAKLATDEKQIVDYKNQVRGYAASLDGATATMASMRSDIEKLTADAKAARQERDERYHALVNAKDEMLNAQAERDRLAKSNLAITAQLARANEALNWAGLNANGNYRDKSPPAGLEGQVVRVVSSAQGEYVEISLGSDDGLRKGHQLEVVRGVNYVGRIEVVDLSPNRAVCVSIKAMQRTEIQKGDHVLTDLSRFK